MLLRTVAFSDPTPSFWTSVMPSGFVYWRTWFPEIKVLMSAPPFELTAMPLPDHEPERDAAAVPMVLLVMVAWITEGCGSGALPGPSTVTAAWLEPWMLLLLTVRWVSEVPPGLTVMPLPC